MGSDDYCVKVRKIEGCDSVCGAAAKVNRGPPGGCISVACDVIKAADAIEVLSSHKNAQATFIKCKEHASSYNSADFSHKFDYSNGNSARQLIPEWFQSPWKAKQVSRSNLTSSKSARPSQIDGFSGTTAIDDFNDLFKKSLKRSISLVENNDLVGQRSAIVDKRVERKASKLAAKNKHDSSIMKACFSTSFSLTSGGNNLLDVVADLSLCDKTYVNTTSRSTVPAFGSFTSEGLYGLKSNENDITQLVDDLSLNKLLDGTFEFPSSSNEKTKKLANSNDSVMPLIRKVCLVLQLQKPAKSENLDNSNSFMNNKMSTDVLTSLSVDDGCNDGDNGEPSMTELSTASKIHNNNEAPDRQTLPLEFCLFQPKELWDRLEPVAPMDMDSLLLEGSKPALPSRSLTDLRLGKQVVKRGCLPAFAWSNPFNGTSRSNSDAAKLSTSRNLCQARWASIESICSLSVNCGDCYSNLDSIRYNKDLVPLVESAKAIPLSKIFSQELSVAPKHEGISSSSAACPLSADNDHTDTERHCPSLLAASRTLYEISRSSPRGNSALLKSLGDLPRKSIKPEKPKWSKKPEEALITATSGSKDRAQNNEPAPLKKPMISNIDLTYRKTSLSWSAPRSSRSSRSLSTKESTTSISKQPCTVAPASRVLNKDLDGNKRPGRSIPLFWGGRDGLR